MEGGEDSMSTSIDERVVAMKFNNGQFQQGVSNTIKALDDLKGKLNFDGAKKSLGDLNTAGKSFDLSGMANGVDTMAAKFSSLQVVAVAALATIASKAVSLGLSMGQSITAAATDGFNDYNTKLTSVQTIMNATGADIGEVSGYFNQLDEYADKTIYNLSDMTGAFAKFTNAGVSMDKSIPAIKGIANMVALAGQDAGAASVAMYNLSQSIGGGFLTTMDFNSLKLANVATMEWKDQMIAGAVAAGTLKKRSDGLYNIPGGSEAVSTAALFSEKLSEGWASADVLTSVLGQYGDATTEIGRKALAAAQDVKSLPMMMETLKAAAGTGWTETFENIFGDLNEAKAMFTPLTVTIATLMDGSADARNSMLADWKALGGRTAIIDSVVNVFHALEKVILPIKKAFREVFPATTGKQLADISKGIRDFTAGLVMSDSASNNIKIVFKGLFTVLKFGFDIVSGIAAVFIWLVGVLFKVGGAIAGLISPVIKFFGSFDKGTTAAEKGVSAFEKVMGFLNSINLQPVIDMFNTASKAVTDFFNGPTPGKWVGKVKSFFKPAIDWGNQLKASWTSVGGFFKSMWTFIEPLKDGIANLLSGLGDAFKGVADDIDVDTILSAINTGFLALIVLSIKKYLDTASGFLDSFTGIMDGLNGVLSAFQTDIKAGALIKIAIAIGLLALALILLSTIKPEDLGPALVGMTSAIAALVGGLALLDKAVSDQDSLAKLPALAFTMILLAAAVLILATAMQKMAALDWNELAKGLVGLAAGLGALVGAAILLSKYGGDLNKVGISLILLSASLAIMAGAMTIFANMSWEQLGKAGAALTVILGSMVGVLLVLSKNAAKVMVAAQALLILSIALGVFTGVIGILGIMPIDVLTQGLIVLSIMLSVLVIAMNALSANAPRMLSTAVAMLAMAFAIGMLVNSVAILGILPIPVLVQGLIALALVMAILVIAMNAMTGAIVGAGAMIIVSIAITLLALAIGLLGAMPIEQLITGLVAIAAVFIIVAVAGLLLAPLTPVLLVLAVALGAIGFVVLAVAVAMVIFSLGLMLFGPAAAIAAGGLQVLGVAIGKVSEFIPAFLGVGAGLLVFGIGAAVAGAGVLILGAGLLLLGVALALIGAVGIIGATALTAIVKSLLKLLPETLNMLALGGAFLVLGAGLLAVGAGAMLAGVGLIMVGNGLLLVAVASIAGSVGLGRLGKAVEKMAPKVDAMNKLGAAIKKLGNSSEVAGAGSKAAASGINAFSSAVSKSDTELKKTTADLTKLTTAATQMSASVSASGTRMSSSVKSSLSGISSAVRSTRSTMQSSGQSIGSAITDGMRIGINNGSSGVTSAAKSVAAKALAASKKELDINSPSRKYEEVGEYSDEGFAHGLIKHAGVVEKASRGVASGALKVLKSSMAGVAYAVANDMDMSPTVRPVLDLSAIRKDAGLIEGMMGSPSISVDKSYNSAARIAAGYSDAETASPDTFREPQEKHITFIQNNNSPKSLSTPEIYRQTKNQISAAREALP